MLTHLPGWTSQPSRKGVTSNIFILRCSFHKTAKRLSITSLTSLLRLPETIQSSIVRHIHQKSLQKIQQQTTIFCPVLWLLLLAPTYLCCCMAIVIRYVILLQPKTEKNTKYHKPSKKNTDLSTPTTNFRLPFKRRYKNHGLDYFTETNLPKASN